MTDSTLAGALAQDRGQTGEEGASFKWARHVCQITGLTIAARRMVTDPESGYDVESEAAVAAILDKIKELTEQLGDYLAQRDEPQEARHGGRH